MTQFDCAMTNESSVENLMLFRIRKGHFMHFRRAINYWVAISGAGRGVGYLDAIFCENLTRKNFSDSWLDGGGI